MTQTLQIKIEKNDFARFVIQRPRARQNILLPIAKQIVNNYRERMMRNTGITPGGGFVLHKTLSPTYKRISEKHFAGPPVLIDTGRMYRSFNILTSSKDRVVLGVRPTFQGRKNKAMTSDKLAAIHHFGSSKMHIPARPHIGFSNVDVKMAGKMFHELMNPEIAKTWVKK